MKGVAHALPSAGINAQCGQRERSDDELVAAARDNPSEFVALYDRYFHRVYGYVRLRVADEATTEDVTSQVFLTALTKMPAFQQRGSFGGWLFRIAQNAVHDVYRRRHTDRLPEAVLMELPDPSESPEQQALTALDAAQLRDLVASLPPAHQDLLALRYGAGLSSREIGRVLGKNPAAVRVGLYRILTDLRRRYSEHDV